MKRQSNFEKTKRLSVMTEKGVQVFANVEFDVNDRYLLILQRIEEKTYKVYVFNLDKIVSYNFELEESEEENE